MPTVYNLGQIAEDIYENTSGFRAAQGISRVRNTTDTSISGFKAAVYSCGSAGVLAFCGSDDLGDVAQDLALFSLYKPQFIQAVHFASRAVRMQGLEPQHTFLTGHSLGAAGVQEAIYSLLMQQEGFVAASANIESLDPEAEGMPIARERLDDQQLTRVMSNSFGFGGTNAVLAFRGLDG